MKDIIIIGGGIAAYTAAIYNARSKLEVLVISADLLLDQLSSTTLVENYPGFSKGIQGPDLVLECKKQAKRFGTKYESGFVKSIKQIKNNFEITTNNKKYNSRAIIIATGASPKKLNIPGEEKYFGKGVSTCATCDAAIFKDKKVVIVGGGDTSIEYALILSKFAKSITIIHRRNEFRASKVMQEKIFKLKDKISVLWDSEIEEVIGDGSFVRGVTVNNLKTNKKRELKCDGMFLAIGRIPNTKFLKNNIKLDKSGYIKTNNSMETNIKGIFAAGDCQDAKYWQAIIAAGSGSIAALEAEKYVTNLD